MILILFTDRAPNALADDLARLGHEVYEALAISEVLALAEQAVLVVATLVTR